MRSSVPSVVSTSQERINICMQALKDVSKVWLVAKMIHTLFESILGNKALEERLQKAAGKRHHRARQNPQAAPKKNEPPKRKFDDMEIGLPNGPPAPQVSYERSRPQTPAVTPSREMGQGPSVPPSMPAPQMSPNNQRAPQEPFLGAGNSRGNTRPTSPFNPSYSVPATPPDLFLVTRNSPSISQSLWENFQPDQLFPDGMNMSFSNFSPPPNPVDPQLQMPSQMGGANIPMMNQSQPQPQPPQQPQHMPPGNLHNSPDNPTLMQGITQGMGGMSTHPQSSPQQQQAHMMGMHSQQQSQWPMQSLDSHMAGTTLDASSQDDNWSNSSRGGPIVPATLNVEDWYVLFSNIFNT